MKWRLPYGFQSSGVIMNPLISYTILNNIYECTTDLWKEACELIRFEKERREYEFSFKFLK